MDSSGNPSPPRPGSPLPPERAGPALLQKDPPPAGGLIQAQKAGRPVLSPVDVPWKNIKQVHFLRRGNLDDFKGHVPPPVFYRVMPEGPALSLEKKFLHSSKKSPGYKGLSGANRFSQLYFRVLAEPHGFTGQLQVFGFIDINTYLRVFRNHHNSFNHTQQLADLFFRPRPGSASAGGI